ncbi:MAG: membrane protein insertion efficiency factor YidD [bacterium]|nr:membrane protein insertion efficiency factor YidD [bacterium]
MLAKILLFAIRLYQRTLSPDHGLLAHRHPQGFCRFYPSCSDYGYRAIERFGAFRGTTKAIWRVMRCNPWTPGGVDEVKGR